MRAPDFDLLIEAAHAAGEIAKRHFRTDVKTWTKGADASPVTVADLEIDTMLRATLLAARPGYGWLSEETEDDLTRLDHGRVFVVDPIDGTRAFMAGEMHFSHALAVVHNGEVEAAVVYLPMLNRTYVAARGQGAALNGTPLRASGRAGVAGATLLTAKPTMDGRHWRAGAPPPFARHFRPSLAYRLALVGQGRFDGMLTLRPTWEWDVAAGTLICTEAGAQVTDATGAPPRFNVSDPRLPGLIAAAPGVHADLSAALVPRTPPDGAVAPLDAIR